MARTIVIGDVHGCHEEWTDLLDRLAVTSSDRLVSVGDLICKGPSTRRTLEMAMEMRNLACVLGNHELRFLECWRAGRPPDVEPYDDDAARDMGDRYEEFLRFLDTWPLWIDLGDLLVIHAGLRPGIPLEHQSPRDLTGIRYVEPGVPWYDRYEGPRTVVFGHWARSEPVVRPRAVGLDTSCVYGGRLSACVFPDREIVSVPARRIHYPGSGAAS
jgi:hypothetical protein